MFWVLLFQSYKMDCLLTNNDAYVTGGSEDGIIFFWDLVDASIVSSFRAHASVVCLSNVFHCLHLVIPIWNYICGFLKMKANDCSDTSWMSSYFPMWGASWMLRMYHYYSLKFVNAWFIFVYLLTWEYNSFQNIAKIVKNVFPSLFLDKGKWHTYLHLEFICFHLWIYLFHDQWLSHLTRMVHLQTEWKLLHLILPGYLPHFSF